MSAVIAIGVVDNSDTLGQYSHQSKKRIKETHLLNVFSLNYVATVSHGASTSSFVKNPELEEMFPTPFWYSYRIWIIYLRITTLWLQAVLCYKRQCK